MKKVISILMPCLILMAEPSALAQSAEQERIEDMELFMMGIGEYRSLNETLYLGALRVPLMDVRIIPESPKIMEMRIVAETLSARRFSRHWMDALTLNSSRDERVAHADAIRAFSEFLSVDLMKGDHVRFEFMPAQARARLLVNGIELGSIEDPGFFGFLLAAWVGDTPISGQLKAGILGQLEEGERTRIEEAYAGLDYASDRQDQVAAILNSREAAQVQAEPAVEPEPQPGSPDAVDLVGTVQPAMDEVALMEAARLEAERLLEAERKAEQLRLLQEQAEAERQAEARRQHEERQRALASDYREQVVSLIVSFAEYPPRAMQRGQTGRVELKISTDREGQVLSAEVLTSSEYYLLDNAALDMVEEASPLPALPEDLEGDAFTFTMPINFTL